MRGAIAPAARSFALAFPAPGVRWIGLTGVGPATLALAWHPDNLNPAVHAFARVAAVLLTPGRGQRAVSGNGYDSVEWPA